jgi:hypothetical protein
LNKMYENIGQGNTLGLGNVGDFANNRYWSSSATAYDVWSQDFSSQDFSTNYSFYDRQDDTLKSMLFYVRAIRAF